MSEINNLTILVGDALEQLKTLPDNSVHCCVTSPPYYGLRDYGVVGQIGGEKDPQQYIDKMVMIFREVYRVLRDDGVLWLNLGDSYGGSSSVHAGGSNKAKSNNGAVNSTLSSKGGRAKDLLMIPSRVALALQTDGWYLRAACPWIKRNAMPESTKDRPTTVVETIFMLTKNPIYYYDSDAVKLPAKCAQTNDNNHTDQTVPMRSRRSSDWFIESWQGMIQGDDDAPDAFIVNPRPYKGAHFATFPPNLIRPCILATTSAAGYCSQCGKPFNRITETSRSDKTSRNESYARASGHNTRPQLFTRHTPTVKTIEWQPGCDCSAMNVLPGIVLDPFGGSGTTGQVALELGRRAILIELNDKYISLIRKRCESVLK